MPRKNKGTVKWTATTDIPPNIQTIARSPGSHIYECNVCNSTESGICASDREILMFCNWHYSRSPECFKAQPPPIPLLPKKPKKPKKAKKEEPSQESLVGSMVSVPSGITVKSNNPKKKSSILKRGGDKKITEVGPDWVRWKSGSYWVQARKIDVL